MLSRIPTFLDHLVVARLQLGFGWPGLAGFESPERNKTKKRGGKRGIGPDLPGMPWHKPLKFRFFYLT